MIEQTLHVSELGHWEQINDAGFILSHLVADGRLLTSPRWLSSAFCPSRPAGVRSQQQGRDGIRVAGVSATANGPTKSERQ